MILIFLFKIYYFSLLFLKIQLLLFKFHLIRSLVLRKILQEFYFPLYRRLALFHLCDFFSIFWIFFIKLQLHNEWSQQTKDCVMILTLAWKWGNSPFFIQMITILPWFPRFEIWWTEKYLSNCRKIV